MSNSQGFYAVSSAVALILAGAGYTSYTQMTGTPPPTLSAPSCDTYAFSSAGDPHIISTLDGQQTVTTLNENQANVETTQNTSGGQTQIATMVTNNDDAHNGAGYVASNSFNQSVSVTHGQSGVSGYWQLTTAGSSAVTGTVTDASGTHQVTAGNPVYEADGSTIQLVNGAIVVLQKLSLGGTATTAISANSGGLDVSTTGNGIAVVNGTAVQQSVGSNNALVNGQTCAANGQTVGSNGSPATGTGGGATGSELTSGTSF